MINPANPYRDSEARRATLEALDLASPYALPEESLRVAVNTRLRPPAGEEEFGGILQRLSEKKAIATVEDSIDEGLVKWTLTEVGKTMLAQLG